MRCLLSGSIKPERRAAGAHEPVGVGGDRGVGGVFGLLVPAYVDAVDPS